MGLSGLDELTRRPDEGLKGGEGREDSAKANEEGRFVKPIRRTTFFFFFFFLTNLYWAFLPVVMGRSLKGAKGRHRELAENPTRFHLPFKSYWLAQKFLVVHWSTSFTN